MNIQQTNLIRDYKSCIEFIERTVASVHGVLTKADVDNCDRLEAQLVYHDLKHVMTAEALDNYYYRINSYNAGDVPSQWPA